MENKLPNVKVIDKAAVVKLEMGAGMIERIQEVLSYFAKQVSQEQIEKYYEEVKDFDAITKKEKAFSEEWMTPVTTISFFLQEIERQAELQGFVKEIDLAEYVKNSADELEKQDPSSEEN